MRIDRTLTAVLSCLAAAVLVSACTTSEPKPRAPEWLSAETTKRVSGVVLEEVRYRSGDLVIRGQVCRPETGGRHPAMIWNHGGFAGVTDWNDPKGICVRAAARGWVVAESTYRGEDGSDGSIEVCHGEVDDVLAMLDVLRGQTYVDPDRVAMVGMSHGGCITSRAVARGARVQVAVDIAGPKDWGALWRAYERAATSPAIGLRQRQVYASLSDTIAEAVGGTPDEYPERYSVRSPSHHASAIARWAHPFLIMHGGADNIVPLQQSCGFADRVGGFRAIRLDDAGEAWAEPPPACDRLSWQESRAVDGAFSADRYLLAYDGVDHFLFGRGRGMSIDLFSFLDAKLNE